jgi:hypothetical protein
LAARSRATGLAAAVVSLALTAGVGIFAAPAQAAVTGTVSATGTKARTHQMTLPAGKVLLKLYWTGKGDLNLFLRNTKNETLARTTSTTAKPETITYKIPAKGTYNVAVSARIGSGTYGVSKSLVTYPHAHADRDDGAHHADHGTHPRGDSDHGARRPRRADGHDR